MSLKRLFNQKNSSQPRLPKQSGGQVVAGLSLYNEVRGLNTPNEFNKKSPSLWEGLGWAFI
jgi:hypothetical protein